MLKKKGEEILAEIRELLGVPAFQADNVLIYYGDCLEVMQELHGVSISLTFTSPPYNIGKEYEKVMSVSKYLDWCEKWIKEIYRLTASNGTFWLNVGYLFLNNRAKSIPIPYLLWRCVPFFLLQEIVWNYSQGVAAKNTFSPRNEKLLWYVKNQDRYTFNLDSIRDPNIKCPDLRNNPTGKNPTDVWQIPTVTYGSFERTEHPAQTPLAVVERIIKGCSNRGDLVFDPFLGSGTLAESALRNGRPFVGIEINKRYVGIVSKRIRACLLDKKWIRKTKKRTQK